MTPVAVASWMGWLAAQGRLKASTIDGYSSAVSSWHKRGTLSDGTDVGTSVAVSLVRTGIHKSLKPAEQHTARDDPLTPDALEALRAAAPGTGPHAVMVMAAASVGVYGCLRPGELLGSHLHRERAIQVGSVSFWADAQGLRSCAVGRGLRDLGPVPHHVTIELGVTKADQTGQRGRKEIAARPAVEALWNWLHLRAELRPPASEAAVFVSASDQTTRWARLSVASLMRQLSVWGQRAGLARHQFGGKSMRQGAAKALMESGAPVPDIMAQGRWATASMPALYAGPDAMRLRRLMVSRAMEPPSATQGAGP